MFNYLQLVKSEVWFLLNPFREALICLTLLFYSKTSIYFFSKQINLTLNHNTVFEYIKWWNGLVVSLFQNKEIHFCGRRRPEHWVGQTGSHLSPSAAWWVLGWPGSDSPARWVGRTARTCLAESTPPWLGLKSTNQIISALRSRDQMVKATDFGF